MSQFKQRFTGQSGIVSLMEDLGNALNQSPDIIMMGGGNPAVIDEVQTVLAKHWHAVANDPSLFKKLTGEYQPPQGSPRFLQALAAYFKNTCAWDVSEKNIAVSNGAQSAFFTLFNSLAGLTRNNKSPKKILLPLTPDYLGYVDVGLDEAMFIGHKPRITLQGDQQFKYAIDFDPLVIDDSIAAVCLSRPTNPSGNIVTDIEIERLANLCAENNTPLIIDLAYGKPFPNVTFVDHHLTWQDNCIFVMSLSKLGLPGARTGLVIANEEMIQRFSRATATLCLAPGNMGPSLGESLLANGDMQYLSNDIIQPYYQEKMQQALDYCLNTAGDIPLRVHQAEGAFFLWLWFEGLPVTSQALYERLKERGVLVLSGHHFFQAVDDEQWPHQHECLRVSYCQPWDKVQQGFDIIFDEVKTIYRERI